MNTIYHLSSCSTNKRIIAELGTPEAHYIDIKEQPLTPEQLEAIYQLVGSYEALINKRAQKFKEMGLSANGLCESKYKELLLTHYTFLKRPVIVIGNEVFAGNAKSTVEAVKKAL